MNKLFIILLLGASITCAATYAQTNTFPSTGAAGIGTTSPNGSSLLDVTSTTKGVLFPRMTKTQRDAIVSPVQGLMIYQTNSTPGFYYYTGTIWSAISTKDASKTLNNLTAPTAVNVELLPITNNTINMGSSSLGWKDLYLNGKLYLDGTVFLDNSGTSGTWVGNTGNTTNSGGNNTATGDGALHSNTTGYSNTAEGYGALYSNTTGISNTANGWQALYSNTAGAFNNASGLQALYSNTTGTNNTANGVAALFSNTTGSYNTALGYSALYNNIAGEANTAAGWQALYSNTTGGYNTASGYYALFSNSTGSGNTASGLKSLYSNTTGYNNAAVGNFALNSNTTGYNNTSLGFFANYSNIGGANNTALGNRALLSNTYGNNNTAVGTGADVSTGDLSNATAIGYHAIVTASNNFVLGDSEVVGWGFGVAAGSRAIKVGTSSSNGNGAYLTLGGTWTNTSSREKKEDFQKQDRNLILEKINVLEVTKWKYKGTDNEYHYGPMADDFFWLFEVGDDSSTSDMDKTGVLFLGIQAMSEENGKLKLENGAQQKQIDELKSEVDQLQSSIVNRESSMTDGFAKLQTPNSKPETLLGQNIPNPFDNSTLIPFRIPKDCNDASIMITNTSTSEVISVIPISCNEDHLKIDAGKLVSGTYSYVLFVDGKMIDTKEMVLVR